MKTDSLLKFKKENGVVKINFLGIKISFKTKTYKLLNNYASLVTSIKYFSKKYELDSDLTKRIEANSQNPKDKKTFEQDKKDLQEHLNTIIDASKLEPATGPLREYQLKVVDIIKDVIPRIEAEGINYFAEGGTLIGVLRHGGFIPWDDDIDFDIPREDFDRLHEYVKKNYLFLDTSNCKNYNDFWLLMNDFLEKHPDEIIFTDLKGYLQAYKGKSVAEHVVVDFLPVEYIAADVSIKKWRKWLDKYDKIYLGNKLTFKQCLDYYRKALNTNKIYATKENSKYFGLSCFPLFGREKLVPVKDVFPLKKAFFEGVELNIPNNPDSYLEMITKDWKHVPAGIDLAHVIKSLNTTAKLFGKEFFVNYEDLLK